MTVHDFQPEANMCAKGNCCGNVSMESFLATLKNVMAIGKPFETVEAARMAILGYISVFVAGNGYTVFFHPDN